MCSFCSLLLQAIAIQDWVSLLFSVPDTRGCTSELFRVLAMYWDVLKELLLQL